MAKKTRRTRVQPTHRPAPPAATAAAPLPIGTPGAIVPQRPLAVPRREPSAAAGPLKDADFQREYPFVGRELRVMGLASGIMLALMVILSFVLR